MANIAWGEAECYISIEAECFILCIARGRAMILSVIKNFINIHSPPLNIPKFADFDDKLHRIQTNLVLF